MTRILRTGAGALVALGLMVGSVVVAPGAALAAEPFAKAERLCASQGGSFQTPGVEHYTCSGVSGISDKQLKTAQRVCEGTYKGTFSSGPTYTCSNIPS